MKIYKNALSSTPSKCWVNECSRNSSYRLSFTLNELKKLQKRFAVLSERFGTMEHPYERNKRFTWVCPYHLIEMFGNRKKLISQVVYESV